MSHHFRSPESGLRADYCAFLSMSLSAPVRRSCVVAPRPSCDGGASEAEATIESCHPRLGSPDGPCETCEETFEETPRPLLARKSLGPFGNNSDAFGWPLSGRSKRTITALNG